MNGMISECLLNLLLQIELPFMIDSNFGLQVSKKKL